MYLHCVHYIGNDEGFISIYVVQKILEIGTDHIKVHLQALEKGASKKHIVTRVEQLCGEDPFWVSHEE
ncbi:hypothetical protein MUK42_32590 [Musa troglodytarum]|uniref:Uncharacterized protein n=1 Tax=Musa troglodytarum TaxID=320322 RepID=A0A9E7FB57_9LILI|nr:hypothetical protein MUK42_32590 [Musa troglodytarum]